ncbi:MAG TPA: ABC transporter permease [bacterium]|nr:ABC transporter permease [bacterium]
MIRDTALHAMAVESKEGRRVIELVVESNHQASVRQALRELWAYRDVMWAFAERNVRLKYKQAALGVLWALIQPLSFLAIFVVLFGRFAKPSGDVSSYPAFALSALIPWMFLQTAVSFGAQALMMDGALLRKVYFAREAPILGGVLGSGLDFAIGLGMLLVLSPFLGIHYSWAMLLAVPLWGILALLASGVAMAMGALTIYYRDFRYALPLMLQLWMFASPVAYPLTAVPERWRPVYILLNPAAGILDGFRRTLTQGRGPDLGLLALSTAVSLLVAWLGYRLFKHMEPGFADVV